MGRDGPHATLAGGDEDDFGQATDEADAGLLVAGGPEFLRECRAFAAAHLVHVPAAGLAGQAGRWWGTEPATVMVKPAARMAAISLRRFSGVMSIGSVAVSMLSSWLSTHNDLPFGTGALSGGSGAAGRLVNARPLL